MSLLKDKIEFYHSLATLLAAGVPTQRALAQRFPGRFQRVSRQLQTAMDAGAGFSQAMRGSPCFSTFECNLVLSGESCGRTPETLRSLADWFQQQVRLRGKIITGLLYPIFIYLVANCLLGLISAFTSREQISQIVIATIVRLLAPFTIYLVGKNAYRLLSKYALFGQLLALLPVFGTLQHRLETARFFKALSLCLTAGLDMARTIDIAAGCCHNRAFRDRFLQLRPLILEQGLSFRESYGRIQSRRDMSTPILALLDTGEQSGTLDVYANRLADLFNDEAARILERLTAVLPVLIYLVIVIYVALKIISLAQGYISELNQLF